MRFFCQPLDEGILGLLNQLLIEANIMIRLIYLIPIDLERQIEFVVTGKLVREFVSFGCDRVKLGLQLINGSLHLDFSCWVELGY